MVNNGILNITSCDVGFTIDGTNYTFTDVDGVVIEDPRKAHIIRGLNSKSKTGLMYKEGAGSPVTASIALRSISPAFQVLLKECFDENTRIDIWVIDRLTGANRMFKDAALVNEPKQLNVTDGAESLNIEVTIESFNYTADHKE